ncbi:MULTISPECIES: LysR family transcriptional regulator [unclassified Pseudoxanthomonas]|uniref:LysR family transcriptional regulator n=1 Tax=unclassified Pseudoxanthomonas TaxID=2645906 RepID=UPI003077FD08
MDRMTAMTVFVEVAERGSLTAAADALDMSRAMATRYLAELEGWLGTRLFHRTTRRISLTAGGELALERCRKLLELSADLQASVIEDNDGTPLHGQLRITCSTSFGQSQMASAAAEYVARHPGVRVDMLLLDRTVNLVEERVDLAIRITHELDPNLIARRLSICRSRLCASPDYLRARGMPMRAEDLASHNCLTHHFVGKSLWQLRRDGREIAVAVGGNISANEASVLLQAVRAGAGVAMLPTFQAAPLLRSGELICVLPDYEVPSMGIYGAYATRRLLPATVRSFLDFLADRFGDEPDWDRDLV